MTSGPSGQHLAPHNQWYNKEVWRRRSRRQRREYPLCQMCLALGRVVPATVADHVKPHRGDWNEFLCGPLQSLCFNCHNSKKRADEDRGYSRELAPDGWPLDPNHPANRAAANRTEEANGGLSCQGGYPRPSGSS